MLKRTPIVKKKCKCQVCKDNPEKAKYPTMSCNGFNYNCLTDKEKQVKGTRAKLARKKSDNRKAQGMRLHKVQREAEGGDKWKSDLWFIAKRFEMTGRCLFCNGKTEKYSPIFKSSAAHLFAKRDTMFPSIKWHAENFIELCFYGISCHTNFDNNILTFEIIKEKYPVAWKEIIRKTKILYPLMTNREKGRVPQILLNEIRYEIYNM